MKKMFLFAALAAAVMSSCSKEEIIDNQDNGNAVGFTTYVKKGVTGRAAVADINTVQADGFYVTAFYTTADWATAGADATPNFMYNQKVTYSAGAWTYTPLKYWPEAGNVSFFAYSPATGATLSAAAEKGAPAITFVANDDPAQQVDLLAAVAADKSSTDGKIEFTFGHILSKVGFAAKLAAQYTDATVKVTSFKLSYAANKIQNSATYTFADGDGAWAALTTPTYHAAVSEKELLTSGEVTLNNDATPTATAVGESMMLVPQAIAQGDITAEITYTVTSGTGDNASTIENTKTVAIPATTLAMNKQYTFNFSLTLTSVELGVTDVNTWGANTDSDMQ